MACRLAQGIKYPGSWTILPMASPDWGFRMDSFGSEGQVCSSLGQLCKNSGFRRQGNAAHSVLSLLAHWYLLEKVVGGGVVQVGLVQERQDLGVSELVGSHKQKFRGSPLGPSRNYKAAKPLWTSQPQASELRPTQPTGGDLDFHEVFWFRTDLTPHGL
jgi:hypothetical protein